MIPYSACKICGSPKILIERSFLKDGKRKSMCQCQICDFAFDIEDNRRAFYGDEYFDGYVADEKARQMRIDEAHWLVENTNNLSGKTYMEVGPGVGHFMEGLQEKAPDIVLNAVEIATRAAESCHKLGAKVIQHDWEGLPYSALVPFYEACDLVVSIHCVEHMDEPLLALRKMAWLLKPGGMLYIHTPNNDNAKDPDWFHYHVEHIALFGECSLRAAFDLINVKVTCIRKLYGDDLIVIGNKRP